MHPHSCSLPISHGRVLARRVGFLLAIQLLATDLAAAPAPVHPLKPQDRSSPRATLMSFLEAGDAAGEFVIKEYIPGPSHARFKRAAELGEAVTKCLDLSGLPAAGRLKAGRAAAGALYETLNRIELPRLEDVPDAVKVAQTNLTHWTIPNTEIRLTRLTNGPHIGEFLFSVETVANATGFYERVNALPYVRKVPLENFRQVVATGGGWMIPYPWVSALPPFLRVPIADQAIWKWILFLLSLALFGFVLGRVYRLSRKGKPEQPFMQALARGALPAYFLIATPALAYFALVQVNLIGAVGTFVGLAASAMMFVGGAWFCWRVAPVIAEAIIASPSIAPESVDAHLIRITTRLLGIAAGAFLLAVGADRLGLPVYGIIAGLGVGGLAIALAAQPTIENLIGGLILFADKPLRVGDLCRYGSDTGRVEAIGIRSTRMRGADRTVTTVPNGTLSKMPIVNFGLRDQTLFKTLVGVRYETSPGQMRYVLARLREMVAGHRLIDPESVRVRLVALSASSQDIEVFAYVCTVDGPEFQAIQEELLLRIQDVLQESGTSLAFPSQTLYFSRDPGLDPERTQAAEAQVRDWKADGRSRTSDAHSGSHNPPPVA